MNKSIQWAIELLENSDNYLDNGFERAISILIAHAKSTTKDEQST